MLTALAVRETVGMRAKRGPERSDGAHQLRTLTYPACRTCPIPNPPVAPRVVSAARQHPPPVSRAFLFDAPFKGRLGDTIWDELTAQPPSSVNLLAACLMPDHLHLIAQVANEDLLRWLGRFKSYTTQLSGTRSTRSCHDPGITHPEDSSMPRSVRMKPGCGRGGCRGSRAGGNRGVVPHRFARGPGFAGMGKGFARLRGTSVSPWPRRATSTVRLGAALRPDAEELCWLPGASVGPWPRRATTTGC
jgi:hypothetical protein